MPPVERIKTLLPFFVCSFILVFVNWMIMAFLPIFLKSIALGDEKIGIVIGIYSISSIIMVLPAGLISDYFSPKRLATASAAVFVVYPAGLYLFREYPQLIILAFLGGTAHSILNIIIYSLFLKVMGVRARGKKIAFFQAGIYLGFGSGPLLGGYIVNYFSFDLLFLVALGLGILLFFLTFTLRDSTPLSFSLKDYRVDLKNRRIILFLAIVLVYATHFGVEQTSFSLLLKEKLHFPGNRIGLVFFILGVWMALLAPLAGHSFDRSRNIILLLVIGILSSSMFQVITGYVSNFEQLVAIRILHTMGDALVILCVGLLTSEFFPEQRLGGHAGIIHITRTLGIFLGNVGSGVMNTYFNYDRAFILNGVFVLAFTLLILKQIRKRFILN